MDRTSLRIASLLLVLTGCSQSSAPPANSSGGPGGTPDQAVAKFLEAVRSGNDQVAAEMLTPTARQEAAKEDLVVAPRGSATAKFKVGQVEYVTPEKDGAHVLCTWTDVDDTGQSRTDEFIWVLRKEPIGWRIAGTVTRVFPNQPPLVLNFEDAADMKRKLQLLSEGAKDTPTDTPQVDQPQANRPDANRPQTR